MRKWTWTRKDNDLLVVVSGLQCRCDHGSYDGLYRLITPTGLCILRTVLGSDWGLCCHSWVAAASAGDCAWLSVDCNGWLSGGWTVTANLISAGTGGHWWSWCCWRLHGVDDRLLDWSLQQVYRILWPDLVDMGVWLIEGRLSTDSWNKISLCTSLSATIHCIKIIFTIYIRSSVESNEINLEIP